MWLWIASNLFLSRFSLLPRCDCLFCSLIAFLSLFLSCSCSPFQMQNFANAQCLFYETRLQWAVHSVIRQLFQSVLMIERFCVWFSVHQKMPYMLYLCHAMPCLKQNVKFVELYIEINVNNFFISFYCSWALQTQVEECFATIVHHLYTLQGLISQGYQRWSTHSLRRIHVSKKTTLKNTKAKPPGFILSQTRTHTHTHRTRHTTNWYAS